MQEGFADVPPRSEVIVTPRLFQVLATLPGGASKCLASMVHRMDESNGFHIPYRILRAETGLKPKAIRESLALLTHLSLLQITKIGAGGRVPAVKGMINPMYAQRAGAPAAGVAWAKLEAEQV